MGMAEKIKEARNSTSITQEKMAEVLGVTRNYVAQMESGRKKPSLELLYKIALLTKSDIREFIDEDEVFIEIKRKFAKRAEEVLREIS